MEWIDVEDRLPPQDAYVLVAQLNTDRKRSYYMYTVYTARRYSHSWFDGKDDEEVKPREGRITHWMPIPDPPPLSDKQ